ncbi:DNA repair protein [Rothia sp. HMSC071C12]|uniref:DNA repair protein n=1 Tax=unclassified Rothia (in: high G+C Gram-positive bacteria) TaxID=2689056 RepID=UPI0008A2A49B|nr:MULTISPECIES: DNA repair protein [unclassified Rothia (in: high G+C Gram-positive bacteria)]OFQ32435.1 DNA repair protein [Rothia sp. HMSC071C12]OHP55235.1 DNA repair protein [Rothia sp. HMSC061D12]
MAQLSIPQSLIGALIDIADLGTLDYFPPTERCAHWSLYDAQRQELLCPCTPAANTTAEKLFEAAAKILYENFPRYIDSPEEIIPYTSRQELVAALRRGDEEASDTKPAEEEQTDLQATEAAEASMAETPVAEANEGVVSEDAAVSATATPQPATPKPAAPKPAPSPALFAARAAQAPAPTPSPAPSVPEEASVEAPAEATAEKTAPIPTPATVAPAAPKPAAPKPAAPTPGTPSPGMFRKSTLTYRPPRIEEYLEGLRARQQAAEAAEATHTAVASEQAPVEELPVLSQSLPSAPAAPETNTPKPSAPKPAAPVPAAPAALSEPAAQPVAAEPTAPRGVSEEDRERSYRLRPSLRARLERENISEELVRTILREGAAERLNDWTIRFTHDDYRVDVNTASAEVITVIDEYDAEYNEAAQASLAQGEYNSLNALELEFSERARTFLKKNPPFVFDLMLQTLNSPESVRMAEGWTRIYAAQGLEIAISPDERTVLALAKTPDFHHLHAEALRKAQLEELSNTLAKQAEDKATQAENTTEEEK